MYYSHIRPLRRARHDHRQRSFRAADEAPVLIRQAARGDARAIDRLAALDERELPRGERLVGELEGRIVAALEVQQRQGRRRSVRADRRHRRAARAPGRAGAAMIVALDEIPRAAQPCDPSLDWRPVRDHLGITAFGVNAFLGAQPGDRVVERHDEGGDAGHEELYIVVRGAARFVIDGDEHDVPAGSVVLVAPGSTREAFATQPATAVLVVGAAAGEPFAVSAWEARQLALGRGES